MNFQLTGLISRQQETRFYQIKNNLKPFRFRNASRYPTSSLIWLSSKRPTYLNAANLCRSFPSTATGANEKSREPLIWGLSFSNLLLCRSPVTFWTELFQVWLNGNWSCASEERVINLPPSSGLSADITANLLQHIGLLSPKSRFIILLR